MPTEHRVSCINKPDRQDRHQRIQNIGGVNPNGSRWTLTEQQAIEEIEAQKYHFYVLEGGVRSEVIVANHLGRKYLKTTSDSATKDNLLSLPECPL